MNIGVLGAVPWQAAANSQSVASLVLDRTWGKAAADITTVLIVFFRPFGRLHPPTTFPTGRCW